MSIHIKYNILHKLPASEKRLKGVLQYWSKKHCLRVKGSNNAMLFVTFVQITRGPRFPKPTATLGDKQINSSRQIGEISTEKVYL
jgi:hypothetical protein